MEKQTPHYLMYAPELPRQKACAYARRQPLAPWRGSDGAWEPELLPDGSPGASGLYPRHSQRAPQSSSIGIAQELIKEKNIIDLFIL